MEFEIIRDRVTRPLPFAREPLFTWPDECFDGQQRLITPAQVKEMGYASLSSTASAFTRQARAHGRKGSTIKLPPGARFPAGGLAVTARTAAPGTITVKRCENPDHAGPNPLPVTAFATDKRTTTGRTRWCKVCRGQPSG
jgi:hypothetical protein